MTTDVLLSTVLVLSKYFSKYDLAYAYDLQIAEIDSVFDGYRDGWDDAINEFAQNVIRNCNLDSKSIRGLLSRISKESVKDVNEDVTEQKRNQEYYDYAYGLGYQISLSFMAYETGYNPQIPAKEIEKILDAAPFDMQANMKLVEKQMYISLVNNEKEENFEEYLEKLLDRNAFLVGKEITGRLKERIPSAALQDKMKRLSAEQLRHMKEAIMHFSDFTEFNEDTFRAMLKDDVDKGLIEDSDVEEIITKFYTD